MARRLSSVAFVAINTAMVFVSLFMIGKALVDLPKNKLTPCEVILRHHMLVTATVILAFSVTAVIGGQYRIFCIIQIYLFTMFLFIIVLIALLIFTLVATGTKSPGSQEGYARETIRYILNGCSFRRIKNCLVDQGLCASLTNNHKHTSHELEELEPVCCSPPVECGYTKWNATYWVAPQKWPAEAYEKALKRGYGKIDCELYQNQKNIWCLDCLVCKQRIIEFYQKPGRKFAMFLAGFVAFIVFIYTLGWFVRNEVGEEYSRQKNNGSHHIRSANQHTCIL